MVEKGRGGGAPRCGVSHSRRRRKGPGQPACTPQRKNRRAPLPPTSAPQLLPRHTQAAQREGASSGVAARRNRSCHQRGVGLAPSGSAPPSTLQQAPSCTHSPPAYPHPPPPLHDGRRRGGSRCRSIAFRPPPVPPQGLTKPHARRSGSSAGRRTRMGVRGQDSGAPPPRGARAPRSTTRAHPLSVRGRRGRTTSVVIGRNAGPPAGPPARPPVCRPARSLPTGHCAPPPSDLPTNGGMEPPTTTTRGRNRPPAPHPPATAPQTWCVGGWALEAK